MKEIWIVKNNEIERVYKEQVDPKPYNGKIFLDIADHIFFNDVTDDYKSRAVLFKIDIYEYSDYVEVWFWFYENGHVSYRKTYFKK